MKRILFVGLILFQTAALYSQSEITLSINEARLLHKQQIRLVFCDSARVVLIDQYKTCKEQKSLLKLTIDTKQKDISLLEGYNSRLKTDNLNLQNQNKTLLRKNRLLKIGFMGGLSLGAAVGFGLFLLK